MIAPEHGPYDYIIAGGGTAGCLLANRLSASGCHSVLLLEAGGESGSLWFRVPVGYRKTIANPASDWCYTSEPEPWLAGRSLPHPRGKVLGGSTAINGMVTIRGQAADYDHWRSLGLAGWGWDDVLPHFKRHEDFFGGADAWHGSGGEWRVDAPRVWWPVLDAVRDAAVQAGVPRSGDFNRGDNEGVGLIHVSQKDGRRWSAANAFLEPARARPNLAIRTGALVDRVLFDASDGRRASGLTWLQGGVRHSARARAEVILAAGAFGSPACLLRSGIGPPAQLAELGIAVVAPRDGVGANLQDHLQLGLRYRIDNARTLNQVMNSPLRLAGAALQYAATRRGPLTMAPCQLGLFARSSNAVARADLGYNVLAFSKPSFHEPFDRFPGLTMIVYNLRPTSRGMLQLNSADAAVAPSIRMNYLATENDRVVAADAIRLTRRIMAQPALAPHRPQEIGPGADTDDRDRTGLEHAFAERATSIYHPVGSARMGLADDPDAVVDDCLRVIGVERLRVIDASVMPTLVSGNTAAPTLMIAEKGAAAVLADAAR